MEPNLQHNKKLQNCQHLSQKHHTTLNSPAPALISSAQEGAFNSLAYLHTRLMFPSFQFSLPNQNSIFLHLLISLL